MHEVFKKAGGCTSTVIVRRLGSTLYITRALEVKWDEVFYALQSPPGKFCTSPFQSIHLLPHTSPATQSIVEMLISRSPWVYATDTGKQLSQGLIFDLKHFPERHFFWCGNRKKAQEQGQVSMQSVGKFQCSPLQASLAWDATCEQVLLCRSLIPLIPVFGGAFL